MCTYQQCLIDCNVQKKNTSSMIRLCNLASSIEITYKNQGDLVNTKCIISCLRKRENILWAAPVQIYDVVDRKEHFHLQGIPFHQILDRGQGVESNYLE